jgi:uncharacterized RDD family membrane protein YckC
MCAPSAGSESRSPQVLSYGTSWSAGMDSANRSCPLCGRPLHRERSGILFRSRGPVFLYGFPVCRKCRNWFANRRQGAFLIDIILWRLVEFGIIAGSLSVLAAAPGPAGLGGAGAEAFGLLLACGLLFVFPFRDAFSGFSPGKWLCGLQVVDRITREPISASQSYKRNLPMLVPLAGILIALNQMMSGPRWGDGWANSVVIWRKYAHKFPFDPRGIYCLGCGYDLTGNVSGVCPECGTAVPTAQPVGQAIPQALPPGGT